jgi:hypothetical protein
MPDDRDRRLVGRREVMISNPTEGTGPRGQGTDRKSGHPAVPSGPHPAIRKRQTQLAHAPLVANVDRAGAWNEYRHAFSERVVDDPIRVPNRASDEVGQGEHQRAGRRCWLRRRA